MPSLYTFTDYSPRWPTAFAQEAEKLGALFGDLLVTIHHIGSTSVPGLAAKPIIDMLPIVRDITLVEALAPAFEAAGYRYWGEYGLPGRRYFIKDQGEYRTHNIHTYQVGDPDIERHLAFCTYLRSHEEARVDYEALKREVYAMHPADVGAYNDGKNAWIKRVEQVAMEWYRQRTDAAPHRTER
ncbi:Glutamate-rich protein grpB [Minicystis rosea]|nr:Glutamate-rich protein grpB [Minicystis rosea]